MYLTLLFAIFNLNNVAPENQRPRIRWGESHLIHEEKDITFAPAQSPDGRALSTLFDNKLTVDVNSLSKDTLITKTFKIKQALKIRKSRYKLANDLRFIITPDSTTQIAITFKTSDNNKFTIYYDDLQDFGDKTVRLKSGKIIRRNLEYTIEIVIKRQLNSGQCLVQFDSSDIVLLTDN